MAETKSPEPERVVRSEDEWKEMLSPTEYEVARCSATEAPFTGKYWNHKGQGMYNCVGCGEPLFSSEVKYDSRSGWPSFWDAVDRSKVEEVEDRGQGMVRTEVRCRRCGSHLGHLFDDGPDPTGMRYCINSASLRFEGKGAKE